MNNSIGIIIIFVSIVVTFFIMWYFYSMFKKVGQSRFITSLKRKSVDAEFVINLIHKIFGFALSLIVWYIVWTGLSFIFEFF